MRVLGLCKGIINPRGGAQSAARNWFARLNSAALGHQKEKLVDVMEEPDYPISRLRKVSNTPLDHLAWHFLSNRAVSKATKSETYQVIHIHCYSGYSTRAPHPQSTLITLHDEPFMEYHDSISPAYARLIDNTLNLSASFFRRIALSETPWVQALSSTVRSQLLETGYEKDRIRVIPHGFLPRVERNEGLPREEALKRIGLDSDCRYVLCVGNINFRKGALRILESCEYLYRNKEDIEIVMVGRIENILEKSLARALNREKARRALNNFHLTGFLPKNVLDGLMWGCNAFLSASYSETGPLALMEAARNGVPIVATDVGAARDFHVDRNLLPRNCTPEQIYTAIVRACKQSRLVYGSVDRFRWDRVITALIGFYGTIVEA